MRLLGALEPVPLEFHHAVVAIGNFDGLHRGHQELLLIAKAEAERLGKSWGIVTFEPHPRSFFKPDEPVFRLTPLPLKVRLAAALGASFVLSLNFDKALSMLEPQDFIQQYLVEKMKAAHVVTGYDFHFGRGRKGNPAILKEFGQQRGFDVTVVDQVADEDDSHSPFSSSSIRSALRRGHMAAAARDLIAMGFQIVATKGTAAWLATNGITSESVAKVYEGRPNIVDRLKNDDIALVMNTTEGTQAISDSRDIRRVALMDKIPYFTTAAASIATVAAMKARGEGYGVRTLQG